MAITDYYTASDEHILKELGDRVRVLRIRKNITQEHLAERTLLAIGTIKALEAGKARLATLVAVLRELGALEQLDRFIPAITISPLKMAETSASTHNTRKRASGSRRKVNND